MTDDLEQRLKAGDLAPFAELFLTHRPRIWQIIHFRLSEHVRGRVDPDDVVQEVYLAAEKRLSHFVQGEFPSLFLWLRLITNQTLRDIHRTHLDTEGRSVLREANLAVQFLSDRFVAHLTSPSQKALKMELIERVRVSLESMNDIDREVLILRHFEELTNQEVASELGITPKAASIRYVRALERLRGILDRLE